MSNLQGALTTPQPVEVIPIDQGDMEMDGEESPKSGTENHKETEDTNEAKEAQVARRIKAAPFSSRTSPHKVAQHHLKPSGAR